ncbi:MAG: type II secretion system protein [Cyanobacteriota bacterium]
MKLIKTKKQVMAFSIIESMIVIVIGSILVGITSLNFTASANRAKITAVKNNMNSLQTMLETYAAEREGTMPSNMEDLRITAQTGVVADPTTGVRSNVYWKELINPFTSYTGIRRKFDGSSASGNNSDIGAYADICPSGTGCIGTSLTNPPPIGGTIIYSPVKQSIGVTGILTQTSYYIYGSGRPGTADVYIRKQEDINKLFVVTNND